MHHMQKYILDRLRFEQPLSYSRMLPKDIESSQFMYHLKQLIQDGLVHKESRGHYRLTHEGLAAVEYMSVNQNKTVRMPKVITYTLLTCKDQAVLMRKQKEPYRNLIELVAGKIHFGENPDDAAQREVFEKLGLKVTEPEFAGIADMLISKNRKPLTHLTVYAHRVELEMLPQALPPNAVVGRVSSFPKEDLLPGIAELLTAIQTKPHPFFITIRSSVPN